jgi:predicted phage terminase large subunit-like protein
MEVVEVRKRLTGLQIEFLRRELRAFIPEAWQVIEPGVPFQGGRHIDAIADHLTFVSLGDISDLLINVPPRHTKSTTVAVCWPAWEWTWNPSVQWLFATYAQALTIRDSVKCRRLIASPWYRQRWGHIFNLTTDQNQKQRFDNSKNGYRLATSVGGTATGEGGDRIVVDDAHNMNEVESDVIREGVISWWRETMSTRRNNPKRAGRVIVGQRGHHMDLPGYAISTGNWVHLNLPGYFVPHRRCKTVARRDGPPRVPKEQPPAMAERFREPLQKGELIWQDWRQQKDELLTPTRFGRQEMVALAQEMTERAFAAQVQQEPSEEDGNILKRKWWRKWEEPELPKCHTILQVYDTAFEPEEENDYSARTTWGIFEWTETASADTPWTVRGASQTRQCAIMLDRMKERFDYPTLRHEAIDSFKLRKPDKLIIEKKASGHALAQELRRAGLPVIRVKVSESKTARAHAASLVMERGCIWYPPREWAQDVIEECAQFPTGEHDDLTDTVTMLCLYLRRRWIVGYTEEDDDIDLMRDPKPKVRRIYG